MDKRCFFIFVLGLLPSLLTGQDFAGTWTGILTQDGKPDRFVYEIQVTQHGNKVSGFATSRNENGGGDAKFEMGGLWDGETLTLQEVKQLKPENARWCLKHIRLSLIHKDGAAFLEGSWEAKGCTPGTITLRSASSAPANNQHPIPITQYQPLNTKYPISGKYTGQLSQSDRDYGFYFEMWLAPDGTGTSRIISDGEGGNASHAFGWSFDEAGNKLYFEETEVLEKSVATWPWCIKSGQLSFTKEENRLSLRGNWEGYIEGYSANSGACAPGQLYVEQPVFKKEELATTSEPGSQANTTPAGVRNYEQQKKRAVQVDRVLEVRSKTVRVRVWDNGTVDGDVLSLFINGEMILENYRVTRRKHVTIVKLDKPVNYLILHAINLGSITPNTVAVSVDDGTGEQVVIMSSNLDESGAIMIRQFTVGN